MTALPEVTPDLEVADFDDELVVLVTASRRAVRLTPGPALVFDSCRRRATLEELLDELATVIGADTAEASTWLSATLVELARHGLVGSIDGPISDASPPV